MDHHLKHYVFKLLYYVALNNGKDLYKLFPDSFTEKDTFTLEEFLNDPKGKYKDFYMINKIPGYRKEHNSIKHVGRNCGRKFRVGEPLYRCQECGYDDTCVLCIHCFNPKDHQNHHIYTDICNDFTTGICDCGDEEAWNQELHCKANDVKRGNESDDENDILFNKESVSLALRESLNYFIDLFNQNIEPLPTFTKDITMYLRQLVQEKKMDDLKAFLEDLKYKNIFADVGSEDHFAVMIYNDEYHNYSQATTALRQGSPDNVHTDILTSKIDSEGRAMLKCSDDVDTLMPGFFAVQTNGLCATLTSWSEYIHQESCKYIVQWMAHCLTIPISNYQTVFRETLGEVLTESDQCLGSNDSPIPAVNTYFPNKLPRFYGHKFLDLSLLDPYNNIPEGYHKMLPASELNSISNTSNETVPIEGKEYENTRLQYLLYFDNRFWKKLRKDLQNVIIPTLASSIKYKPIFCEQVVEIFNHITRSIAFMDREPQLTALRECVVQLFTCPTNAKLIFGGDNGYFIDIVWSVIDIFVEFSKVENGTLVWQRVQKSNPTKSYGISMKQGLYTIETLISKVNDANILLRPKEFISIVTLCKLFNGAWKLVRKEGEHVVHEDQHFIPYLEYTTSIYSIIQTMVNALVDEGCDKKLLLNSIRLINTFLGYKSLTYKLVHNSHEIIKFSVASDRVAYMNPIHTFFSFLIENVPLIEAYETIVYQDTNSGSPVPAEISSTNGAIGNSALQFKEQYEDKVSQSFDFLKISDFSLRTVVLCAQADVGFWVRNGSTVLHQTSYYKNNPELNTYSRDIHLNQLAFLWEIDDTPRVIYNMLDRWMLLDWFDGNVEFQETEYQDKISLIVQHFIAFVYQVLTERQFFQTFKSPKEKKLSQIKNAIMYNLFTKPLSYSKLLRLVPDYLTEDSTLFDAALEEISIFKEPQGLTDNGVFKLKEKYYTKIDPLKLSNLDNEFETSAMVIKKHLNKGKKGDGSSIILEPQLVSPTEMDEGARLLGSFTRHPVFAKIVYKLLQVCLDTNEGVFLNELLHLVHGIFMDDEQTNGDSSFPDAYLSKPICNLLMSIVNSSPDIFSKNIRTNADFLLKQMIEKRSEDVFDSLTAGFGEEYINKYKDEKLNTQTNTDESERERKRKLAKKHQARLMAKFSNQQNKFMKENEVAFKDKKQEQPDADGDIDMSSDEKSLETEDFTCSLCQDNESEDIFVVPTYHDHSPIFWSSNKDDIHEYMPEWDGFENDNSGKLIEVERSDEANSCYETRKVFVSCNHHIHYNCFRRYIQKKRFSSTAFICPLCQSFSNSVMVVHKTAKKPDSMSIAIGENKACEVLMNCLTPSGEAEECNISDVLDSVFQDTQYFGKEFRKSKYSSNGNTAKILTINFANTISMLEISSRLDKNTNQTFLKGEEQKFKTLKNLLIFILEICKTCGMPDISSIDLFKFYKKFGNYEDNEEDRDDHYDPQYAAFGNELFQLIVSRCLFEDNSLKEIITGVLRGYFVQFARSQLENSISINFNWIEIRKYYKQPPPLSDALRQRILDITDGQMRDLVEHELDSLPNWCIMCYYNFLRHILPTLRRCLILLKTFQLVTSEYNDNEFIINGMNMEEDLIPEKTMSLPETVNRMLSVLTDYSNLEELLLAETYPYTNTSANLCGVNIINDDYCGVIKLINLAEHLNTYVTDTNAVDLPVENSRSRNASNRLDFKICLLCGTKIHARTDRHELSRHLSGCQCFNSFGAFLLPNSSEVCLQLHQPPSSIFISAPYLNSHGEAGRNAMKRGDLTTLNLTRYEHLNKLWINNEIPRYISRVMGDEFRVSILSNGFLFALNRDPTAGRRVPPVNDADDSEDDFMDEGDGFFSDEDMADEDRFRNLNGQTGDVRDFFEIFQTVRNAMDNGENEGGDVDLTTPFLQMFGQQFRAARDDNDDDDDDDEDNADVDRFNDAIMPMLRRTFNNGNNDQPFELNNDDDHRPGNDNNNNGPDNNDAGNNEHIRTVFVGAFLFQTEFDTAITKWYENHNKGKLWKDVKARIGNTGGDDEDEE
ncbi:E3 ubiquitin-protein ligase ubr1 [Maudiozyma exigua]|uniref:E3 ubiquitin-protein ligase n=1 Tax=Maudiozyma exigua TaxID=34358 RepID=A0A9P6W8Z0_MAUEX|nr:E3 ubiquitin-protein ligase ubr1 [Kazachstania exigua]